MKASDMEIRPIERLWRKSFLELLKRPRRIRNKVLNSLSQSSLLHPRMRARLLLLMGVRFSDPSNVLISSGVYIDEWNPHLIHIGKNVGIAMGVKILTHFYDITQPPHHHKIGPVFIEDDASLLFNVVVADSVRIGKGAVVGANSVVTRDIPPYAIAAGSPCKPIGIRPSTWKKFEESSGG